MSRLTVQLKMNWLKRLIFLLKVFITSEINFNGEDFEQQYKDLPFSHPKPEEVGEECECHCHCECGGYHKKDNFIISKWSCEHCHPHPKPEEVG